MAFAISTLSKKYYAGASTTFQIKEIVSILKSKSRNGKLRKILLNKTSFISNSVAEQLIAYCHYLHQTL